MRVPGFVFGAMANHGESDAQRILVLEAALEFGITAIDTAPLYEYGRAEQQVAAAMRTRERSELQILTKVGLRWDDDSHGDILYSFHDASGQRLNVRKNSRPASIQYEVEQSLARLQVETLDLVQVHHPDIHTPMAESMGALLDLKAAGKLQHIGVSNYSAAQVNDAIAALGTEPLAFVQQGYSLLERDLERDLLATCLAHDVGILAHSPLARGEMMPGVGRKLTARARRLYETCLQPMAQQRDVAPAAIAWAWVRAQRGVSAVIAGASSTSQLEQLLAGIDLVLNADELAQLQSQSAETPLMALQRLKSRVSGSVRRRVARFF